MKAVDDGPRSNDEDDTWWDVEVRREGCHPHHLIEVFVVLSKKALLWLNSATLIFTHSILFYYLCPFFWQLHDSEFIESLSARKLYEEWFEVRPILTLEKHFSVLEEKHHKDSIKRECSSEIETVVERRILLLGAEKKVSSFQGTPSSKREFLRILFRDSP
ncbi:hypothetical protein TNCV_2031021 [Trichonephila clavipes]|nr:hypothetical protein TNCV_2031021 [Trichonephila clavipes]